MPVRKDSFDIHDPAVVQCLQYDAVVREAAANASFDQRGSITAGGVQRTWSFSRSSATGSQMRQLIAREEVTRAQAFQTALLEQGFYTYAVLLQAIVGNLSRVSRGHRRRSSTQRSKASTQPSSLTGKPARERRSR